MDLSALTPDQIREAGRSASAATDGQAAVELLESVNDPEDRYKHREDLTEDQVHATREALTEVWPLLDDGVAFKALSYISSTDPMTALRLLADRYPGGVRPDGRDAPILSIRLDALEPSPEARDLVRPLFNRLAEPTLEAWNSSEFRGYYVVEWSRLDVLMQLAAVVELPEGVAMAKRIFQLPPDRRWQAAVEVAKAHAGFGLEEAYHRRLPEPVRCVPPPGDEPHPPGHVAWVWRKIQDQLIWHSSDGLDQVYCETRPGHVEEFAEAGAAFGSPVAADVTARAAARVREHAVMTHGVLCTDSDEDRAFFGKLEKELFDPERVHPSTLLDLYVLRHASLLGGRDLDWLPAKLEA